MAIRSEVAAAALNDTVRLELPGGGTVGLQVVGAFTGQVDIEQSLDGGTTFVALEGQKSTDGTDAANLIAPGIVVAKNVAPGAIVRGHVSALTVGNPKVILTGAS